MYTDEYGALAEQLMPVAKAAGRVEMDVLARDFTVDTKNDASPVTEADKAAEAVILEALAQIAPDIPVIAEEAASEGHLPRFDKRFFLVDPLDGTKEFIARSGEFTVNIALIDDGQPVFGLVYAPAIKEIFLTIAPQKAVLAKLDPYGPDKAFGEFELQPLSTRRPLEKGLNVVASKSHMTDETRGFIEQFEVTDLKSAGSSLKFCLLAKGEADLYPRFGPTMEWDTAAGHSVLKAAGGRVTNEDGSLFVYGKTETDFLNPFFIAWADKETADQFYGEKRI